MPIFSTLLLIGPFMPADEIRKYVAIAGGEEQVFGSATLAENGAIVSDAEDRALPWWQGYAFANPLDEIQLAIRNSDRARHSEAI